MSPASGSTAAKVPTPVVFSATLTVASPPSTGASLTFVTFTDPTDGRRPWGLVVGKNRFIAQSKMSEPRAVPAVSPAALDNLHRAALFFEEAQRDGSLFEGDWRRRSLHQRRVFARHHLDENMFFAKVNSTTLDALRQGTKWAVRAKQSLQLALSV